MINMGAVAQMVRAAAAIGGDGSSAYWMSDAEIVARLQAANTAYAASSAPVASIPAIPSYSLSLGAVIAPNGKIYFMPATNGIVRVFDPVAGTVTNMSFGLTIPSSSDSYLGAVLGRDGKIYAIPGTASQVLVINTADDTAILTDFGLTLTGGVAKWFGGTEGRNGKIYCAPWNASNILVIDTATGTASLQTFGLTYNSTSARHLGGTRGLDGKIYMAPFGENRVLIIDPATETATHNGYGLSMSIGSEKFASGTIAADGKLWFPPYQSTSGALCIDTAAGTASYKTLGVSWSGSAKWEALVNGPDGKLYGIPRTAPDILVIDPVAGTGYRSNFGLTLSGGTHRYFHGLMHPDGKIYGIPGNVANVLKIDFGAIPALPAGVCLHPALNRM